MAPEIQDPRMMAIHPRIRYNTIGGINGPLVILDNVRSTKALGLAPMSLQVLRLGQVP